MLLHSKDCFSRAPWVHRDVELLAQTWEHHRSRYSITTDTSLCSKNQKNWAATCMRIWVRKVCISDRIFKQAYGQPTSNLEPLFYSFL